MIDYLNRHQNQLLNKELITILSRLPKNLPVYTQHWVVNKSGKQIESWTPATNIERIKTPDDTPEQDQLVIRTGLIINKKRPIK